MCLYSPLQTFSGAAETASHFLPSNSNGHPLRTRTPQNWHIWKYTHTPNRCTHTHIQAHILYQSLVKPQLCHQTCRHPQTHINHQRKRLLRCKLISQHGPTGPSYTGPMGTLLGCHAYTEGLPGIPSPAFSSLTPLFQLVLSKPSASVSSCTGPHPPPKKNHFSCPIHS